MAGGQPKQGGRRGEPAPTRVPGPDWVVVALALAGLLVAGYLTYTKLTGGTAALCTEGGGCDIVQASRYATLLGVPTAAWGAALYVAIGVVAALGLTARRWPLAFLLAVAGVAFSLYMTAVAIFELRTTCGWCLVSAGLMLSLLAVLWTRRSVVGRRAARPGRLAWQAGATAVATVVAGAFVFAGSGAGDGAYQEALARHLGDSGAIFYGAFW